LRRRAILGARNPRSKVFVTSEVCGPAQAADIAAEGSESDEKRRREEKTRRKDEKKRREEKRMRLDYRINRIRDRISADMRISALPYRGRKSGGPADRGFLLAFGSLAPRLGCFSRFAGLKRGERAPDGKAYPISDPMEGPIRSATG
jgi:hypothetical protein